MKVSKLSDQIATGALTEVDDEGVFQECCIWSRLYHTGRMSYRNYLWEIARFGMNAEQTLQFTEQMGL